MSLLTFFRKSSAPVARERLQVLLSHERLITGKSDLIATLQEEILAVIARHVSVEREKVQIKLDRGSTVSMLEIDIEVPAAVAASPAREIELPEPEKQAEAASAA